MSAAKLVLNGRSCISGSLDGKLILWDLGDGDGHFAHRRVFEGHTGPITSLDAAGGLILSGSTDGTVRLWSERHLNALHVFELDEARRQDEQADAFGPSTFDRQPHSLCSARSLAWQLGAGGSEQPATICWRLPESSSQVSGRSLDKV